MDLNFQSEGICESACADRQEINIKKKKKKKKRYILLVLCKSTFVFSNGCFLVKCLAPVVVKLSVELMFAAHYSPNENLRPITSNMTLKFGFHVIFKVFSSSHVYNNVHCV